MKPAYFKSQFKTYLFCLPDWDWNIAKYFKRCFPRPQAAVTPIHTSSGDIFFYRVLNRRVQATMTSVQPVPLSCSCTLLSPGISEHPRITKKSGFPCTFPAQMISFLFISLYFCSVLVLSTDICGACLVLSSFSMGLLTVTNIQVERLMAYKPCCFKNQWGWWTCQTHGLLCVSFTIDKLIQCLSLYNKMN